MSKEAATVVKLKVSEALAKDVGRALARVGPEDMRKLGAVVGDIVEVSGKRSAVCKIMPAYMDMRGQSRVQLDGLSRENAGASLDETVSLRKVAAAPAQRLSLTPLTMSPDERHLRYIAGLLDGLPVQAGQRIRATLFGSRFADFRVEKTVPEGPVLIHPLTELSVEKAGAPASRPEAVPYEDIGGLRSQMQRIREMIELPLRHPEVFERLGIDAPRGVLLHGAPGCGKTLIARAIAHESEASFHAVSGPEIVHKFYGESEAHLRRVFEEAARAAPAIIFLDEIDAIAPRREQVVGDVEKRIVAQLLALMDGLKRRSGVIVIGATNIPNALDPALRRPGRFDREIAIPVPDANGRLEILEIHSRGMPLAKDVDLRKIAEVTHGFVGADLEALCREAAMVCLRGLMNDIDFSLEKIPYEQLAKLEVDMSHFTSAMQEVEPSAIREVFVEIPHVRWGDIGGLSEIKEKLTEAVEWPLHHADLLKLAGVPAPKGILLSGPPGCGKTMLAKAMATETNVNFISVKGPALLSKYVGESERQLRDIFKKARQAAPCIVFFDEIDAMTPVRGGPGSDSSGVTDRILAQFLAEMDGVEELKGVLVMAATNRPDRLDPALLRPGRFDFLLQLPLPDEASRAEIFRVRLRGRPVASDVNAAVLAALSEGLSGAQIAAVCDRAAMRAVRRAIAAGENQPDLRHLPQGTNPGVLILKSDLDAELEVGVPA